MKTFNVLLISVLISIASIKGFSFDFGFLPEKEPAVEQKAKLIIFSATWCGPCNAMKKFMFDKPSADMVELLDNYDIIQYDFDQSKDMVRKYKVDVVPYSIIEKDDKEIARMRGFSQSKLVYFLDKYK